MEGEEEEGQDSVGHVLSRGLTRGSVLTSTAVAGAAAAARSTTSTASTDTGLVHIVWAAVSAVTGTQHNISIASHPLAVAIIARLFIASGRCFNV